LFVTLQDHTTSAETIFTNFGGKVSHWPRKKLLDFRDNPCHVAFGLWLVGAESYRNKCFSVSHGVCMIVTVLRYQLRWQSYPLYWVELWCASDNDNVDIGVYFSSGTLSRRAAEVTVSAGAHFTC